jgi:prepilin-type N-terminal cleavage/methylation domain-containing protein/prepilin-type processing-associated H-X9-DG protein
MKTRAGFTLIELLVVIAIIALLIGILLPALGKARSAGRTAVCLSSQKQMATALASYFGENDDYFVGDHAQAISGRVQAATAPPRLRAHMMDNYDVWFCPEADKETIWDETETRSYDKDVNFGRRGGKTYDQQTWGYFAKEAVIGAGFAFSYGYNGWGVKVWAGGPDNPNGHLGLGGHTAFPGRENIGERYWWEPPLHRVRQPADMIVMGDSDGEGDQDQWITPERTADRSWPSDRHSTGAVIMFADGHAAPMPIRELLEQTDQNMRRWNNDYDPHEELWE